MEKLSGICLNGVGEVMQTNMDLLVITPKVYEDIDRIAENLGNDITSVVNLETKEEEVAKKIAKHILENLKNSAQVVRVAERVFCVAPFGVNLSLVSTPEN